MLVAPNGVAAAFTPAAGAHADEGSLRRLGVPMPYVLAVGRDEPRKAMPAAVAAWREAFGGPASASASAAERVSLVIVGAGAKGLAMGGAGAGPSASTTSPGIVALERVDDADLAALYAAARFTLVPSLDEGFSPSPPRASRAARR